jgi:hypothetical protein
MTLDFGVNGDVASFSGLKFNRAFMIRFEVPGRVLARIDRQFRVASITTALLIAVSLALFKIRR